MNSSKISGALIFVFGAAIGSLAAYSFAKTRYEHIALEEITSVKEAFAREKKAMDKRYSEMASTQHSEQSDDLEYSKIISSQGYKNYAAQDRTSKDKKEKERPYVISPDEFGELFGYEKVSLTLYDDGILADGYDPVDEIDDIIGLESLSHFGEYEDDSVFVRNDARKCDYEILKDIRTYEDVMSTMPWRNNG